MDKIGKIKKVKKFEVETNLDWRKRLEDKQDDYYKEQPNLKKLWDKIEWLVKWSLYNPCTEKEGELDKMINEWEFFWKTDRLVQWDRSQCHRNSSELFLIQDPEYAKENWYGYYNKEKRLRLWKFDLYTGYALSDDWLWRQHTWCISKWNGEERSKYAWKVIETTEKRINYYWYKLEWDELLEFLDLNWV